MTSTAATHPWRLIVETAPRPGAWNMAIDRAMMEAAGVGAVPPTLRFYQWQPAAVSLGKGQAVAVVDATRCAADGVEVVRRPTGGWAIFHTDELTYSVAAHADEAVVAGPLLEAYKHLSAGLIAGLRLLGLEADLAPPLPSGEKAGLMACFEVPYSNEITVGGLKLMGSAQARSQRRLMQHGSLPLRGDVGRAADYLVFPEAAAREALRERLRAHATTASAAAGHDITYDAGVAAMVRGFSTQLGITCASGDLTAEELARAAEIVTNEPLVLAPAAVS
ncbi:MAG: lipoate--protein ligase family protein [Ktedonobacterales bacterium]|nr:lipoate--protein ligase family protein [Ktedonobacterales bacterium]